MGSLWSLNERPEARCSTVAKRVKKELAGVGGSWQHLAGVGVNLVARNLKNNVERPKGKTPRPRPYVQSPTSKAPRPEQC